jgi:hypothetical protein
MTGPKLKIVDDVQLQALHAQAAAGARRRKNLNLHERLDDPVQRLLNDFEPGTYVRPHRHADKWETHAGWSPPEGAAAAFAQRLAAAQRGDRVA